MNLDKQIKSYIIPFGTTCIPEEAFKDFKELETVIIPDSVTEIGNLAFAGCEKLKMVVLPKNLKVIGNYAFKDCSSISLLYIPAYLEEIGIGAFSYMSSLERIEVDPENKKYITYDNLSLMDTATKSLVQYAIGSKNKRYQIIPLPCSIDKADIKFIRRGTQHICQFAFAGCKYLEELDIDTSMAYLEKTAFEDSDNLKTMRITSNPSFPCLGFIVTNNKENDYYSGNFPFEEIYIENGVRNIECRCFAGFKRVRKVELPTEGLVDISHEAFKFCRNLREIAIPSSVNCILHDSFGKEKLIKFANGLQIDSSQLHDFREEKDRREKVYRLEDYDIVEKGNHIIKVSQKSIRTYFVAAEAIIHDPSLAVNYLALLTLLNKDCKDLRNGILVRALRDYIPSINFPANPLITKAKVYESPRSAIRVLLKSTRNLIESPNSLASSFIKYFDANMKRMIELSSIMDDEVTGAINMKDLLNLAQVLGGFEDNLITRQRAITFINDNILTSQTENNKIVDDDIHRVFNGIEPRDEFDAEFARFFMENYHEIYKKELEYPGFICGAYNSFPEIKETCTSDKGSQRQLLVTLDKVCHFAANYKFTNVTAETEELAAFLGNWFSDDEAFQASIIVTNESKSAPRNIFAYSNNPDQDLKEPISEDYYFEWLPKQDFGNLLLGKYCNSCAHINGAGAGIMRASMVSPNHQNMVIRNESGRIIGKSTIYVNREQNYAVFNNVESSLRYRSEEDLEKIYKAFMRGAQAFFERYNENNPDNPLLKITVGATRNTLNQYFDQYIDLHPDNDILEAPQYSDWSLYNRGTYIGDSGTRQRLVLKR